MGASGIFGNRDIPDPDGVYCASGLYASLSGGVSSAIIYYRRNPLVNGSWGIKG